MKKYILLTEQNTVAEIIPEFNSIFPDVPIEERYTKEFIKDLIEVDSFVEVQSHWIYDPVTGEFYEPEPVEVENDTTELFTS